MVAAQNGLSFDYGYYDTIDISQNLFGIGIRNTKGTLYLTWLLLSFYNSQLMRFPQLFPKLPKISVEGAAGHPNGLFPALLAYPSIKL